MAWNRRVFDPRTKRKPHMLQLSKNASLNGNTRVNTLQDTPQRRSAQSQGVDLCGWPLGTASGYKPQLVGRVMSDEPLPKVRHLLEMEEAYDRVLIVGICGIGGIGKTRVTRGCGGFSLALEILGAFLRHGKDRRWWRAAKTEHKEIYESLKISFDDFNHEEKQIFPDIACFFAGRKTEDLLFFGKVQIGMHTQP